MKLNNFATVCTEVPPEVGDRGPQSRRVAESSTRFVVVIIIVVTTWYKSAPNPTQLLLELLCLLSP